MCVCVCARVQELVHAIACPGGNPLLDEVHLCVLRTLAGNESPRDRKRRKLPLDMLDEVRVRARGWGHTA